VMGALSVRIRVALVFALVMGALLAATGLFLHQRLGHELDSSIDEGLARRAGDVSALVRGPLTGLGRSGATALSEERENLAQVLSPSGAVVDTTPAVRRTPLLDRDEVHRASRGTIIVNHSSNPSEAEPTRLLATPVESPQGRRIVVVGALTDDRRDALDSLKRLLLIGGPVALLLASIAAYGAAAAALRPVERMRRRAAAIEAGEPGSRLPVPRADDEIGRLGATLNGMLERLDSSYGQLEHSLAREREFVADASHELRTPLATLKAELDLALRGERDAAALRKALASASEETDRLVRLAEDLLVIARSDQGQLPIRRERVAARPLLATVAGRFSGRAAAAGASLRHDAPEDLAVHVDRLRMEQALGNLVDNALRHGGSTIELTARGENGRVTFQTADDGAGFPPGFEARAFERFTRADSARTGEGAGLGLAIVEAIAKAHGGAAHAAGVPSGGAQVCIELPAGPRGSCD
jgi:two-component system OmpR family sensor kinase